ncbi:substrate-binding domain-containing protein [Brevirhabdus sp.]|uniref:substrate-binding domain-containing protein n=1 Tax=Brevirhabdus sp. TaxID=2004514 RepID=UPI0040595DEC
MKLKDLAQHLGLSQTTVSRALNGYPEVSEATRQRVLDAARQHHYRPNTRARGLATGRAMAIGHVIPLSSKYEMVNPVFADFIAGAGETYSARGYDMVMSVVADGEEERAYVQMAGKGLVDGLLVHAPRSAQDARIPLLQRLGLPFVVHGRVGDAQDFSWLDIDNARSFQRATELLLDLGHRRIALINGLEFMDFAARRRRGYLAALSGRGVAADPALMQAREMTEPYGFRAAQQMLALPDPPSAFVVSSYITAMGVRRALSAAGLELGRDVSVVTHDDDLSYLSNQGEVPIFTATRSSVRQAGRRCAEIVLGLIGSEAAAPVQELWETELTLGLSTGPYRPGGGARRPPPHGPLASPVRRAGS